MDRYIDLHDLTVIGLTFSEREMLIDSGDTILD